MFCLLAFRKLVIVVNKRQKSRIFYIKSNFIKKTKEGAHIYTFSSTCAPVIIFDFFFLCRNKLLNFCPVISSCWTLNKTLFSILSSLLWNEFHATQERKRNFLDIKSLLKGTNLRVVYLRSEFNEGCDRKITKSRCFLSFASAVI